MTWEPYALVGFLAEERVMFVFLKTQIRCTLCAEFHVFVLFSGREAICFALKDVDCLFNLICTRIENKLL